MRKEAWIDKDRTIEIWGIINKDNKIIGLNKIDSIREIKEGFKEDEVGAMTGVEDEAHLEVEAHIISKIEMRLT